MNILIKNILAVLPGADAAGDFEVKQTDVYVEGNRITGVGKGIRLEGPEHVRKQYVEYLQEIMQ